MNARINGKSLIAGKWITGEGNSINGFNPDTNESLEPTFTMLSSEQLDLATAAAKDAFLSYKATEPHERAEFLDEIARQICARREEIVDRAMLETGLPNARLEGELARTVNQLALFGEFVRAGNETRVRIDPAQLDRLPVPRQDIRQYHVPIGPVAVFGASNFPLAFSTAGGDTASALAAGCPVVFKAHNAHPGTSELVAQSILSAIEIRGIHSGVFSLVFGAGSDIGQRLVADPVITAVGFTGSRSGGMSIFKTANQRETPIPVYAEMSAVNPVFVLEGALANSDTLSDGYFGSVTGSCGQLCTKPGLLFLPTGERGDEFVAKTSKHFAGAVGQTMLTSGIATTRNKGVEKLKAQEGVRVLSEGVAGAGHNAPSPVVFESDLKTFVENPILSEEIFGAASLIIRYESIEELIPAISTMEGQLTATVHAGATEYRDVEKLIPYIELIAGRILFGGWPTGVEVGHAMVHGGPFPATTNGGTTSVGTSAIERFLRPVAYQSFPEELRPNPIQDANPWNIPQTIDGHF